MTTKPQSTTEEVDRREEAICRFCDQAIHCAGDEWRHNFNDSIWCRPTTATPNAPASAAPVVDAEKQARDLVDAFRFASPPVQSLRFLEWEPLVVAIADALRAAATAAPVGQNSESK